MEADFLLFNRAFSLNNLEDFHNWLDGGIKSKIQAETSGDRFYKCQSIYEHNMGIGTISDIMNFQLDISRDVVLAFTLLVEKSTTLEEQLTSLEEFEDMIHGDNPGLFGIDFSNLGLDPSKYFYDVNSWFSFHCSKMLSINDQIVIKDSINVLTNTSYSNKVTESWETYLSEVRRRQRGEQRAHYLYTGSIVASRNYFIKDPELSDLNTRLSRAQREIFRIGSGNSRRYISIDFEKGGFEVYNHTGKHQGAIAFDGHQIEPPDDSGDHDIFLVE